MRAAPALGAADPTRGDRGPAQGRRVSAEAGRAAILRRSLRVTVAASVGFYPLLYVADLPVSEPNTPPEPEGYSPAALSVDLEVWMTSLGRQLAHVEASVTRRPVPDRAA
ncbi:hypothetical protein OM788_005904 [Streptomyces sp. KA12]|uniref:hypothetical protein n=1 Tax=Streptomyces sp. KA12 TaxID=2991730 RepID=UPI0023B0DE73|nr:hypothetical protein [Streptomyces sp. KA12]MDF0375953.1 hypothetical protein [Streptomyces sp. KA12]